jgi:hypothetical protein
VSWLKKKRSSAAREALAAEAAPEGDATKPAYAGYRQKVSFLCAYQ